MRAIVFAETRGERMGILTESVPKPMLSVLGRPILEHLILSLKDGGIKDIVISVYFRGDVIKNHFGTGEKFGVSIEYFEPKAIRGMACSLYNLRADIPDCDFIAVEGNLVFEPNLIVELSKAHAASKNVSTVAVSKDFGAAPSHKIARVEKGVISEIKSPNAQISENDFRCIGVWAFSPRVFEFLSLIDFSREKEWSIMTALKILLDMGVRMNCFIYDGPWRSFHYPKDLVW